MASDPREIQSETRYFDRDGKPTLQMLEEWQRMVLKIRELEERIVVLEP